MSAKWSKARHIDAKRSDSALPTKNLQRDQVWLKLSKVHWLSTITESGSEDGGGHPPTVNQLCLVSKRSASGGELRPS